jgi:hypothetical protein
MKLTQFNIALENRHGRLFEVARALGDAGINIRALNLVDTGAFGQLRILVSDVAATRRLLMDKVLPAIEDEVVAVEMPDRPGSLAQVLEPLYSGNVSVNYSYAYVGVSACNAVMIFRFSDNDKAIEILQRHGVKLLDPEAFGIIEAKNECF